VLWVASAPTALAFAPTSADAPARGGVVEAPQAVDVVRSAADTAPGERPTLMERISRKLRRIPLRPVTIGEAPRTPDDPEPGAGITIFIRF
jgi:hypothetical protein